MKKAGTILLILVLVGGLLWLFISDKGRSLIGMSRLAEPVNPSATTPSPEPSPVATILTRIQKNAAGTSLVLVSYNSITGVVVSSKNLSFEEAVKLLGTYNKVCSMASYETCKSIRQS